MPQEVQPEPPASLASCETELGLSKFRAAFYKKVIERYSDTISAAEEKTIPLLKSLINPKDEAVLAKKTELLEKLGHAGDYEFDRDFMPFATLAAEECFGLAHIKSELPIPFWLTPKEIFEIGAADEFDRAILLCALLESAGCSDVMVRVLQLEGGGNHQIVAFQFGNSTYWIDPSESQRINHAGNDISSALVDLTHEGRKFVASRYEFNSRQYSEF